MAKKQNKIIVETTIKSCNVKEKGESITFESITLTTDEREKVIQWVKDKTFGKLSFEPIQENLPGME